MADKFTFGSAGEIQDVEFALARNGWTHPLLKKATGGNFFELVREVLEGRAEICRVERLTAGRVMTVTAVEQHIIDCDAVPLIPGGLRIEKGDQLAGRVRGQFVFDPAKIKLHLSPNQQGRKCIKGDNLALELASEPVLPANVLDFYLANLHFIPEDWKGKYVFFWGTIYCVSLSILYVRYLYFNDGRWLRSYYWLGNDWPGSSPAALRAS